MEHLKKRNIVLCVVKRGIDSLSVPIGLKHSRRLVLSAPSAGIYHIQREIVHKKRYVQMDMCA